MERLRYLRALRRRWVVVAVAVAVALGGALAIGLVIPDSDSGRYQATAILVGPNKNSKTGDVGTIAAFITIGQVPERVADRLGGNPGELASAIETAPDVANGFLYLTATADTPRRAELLSNVFAEELIASRVESQEAAASGEARTIRGRIEDLEKEIRRLDRQVGAGDTGPTDVVAQRDALAAQLQFLYQRYGELTNAPPADPGIYILQEAKDAVPVGGLEELESPVIRFGIAAFLGLLGGAVLALVLDRFDTRIRTRSRAERHFGMPVVGEIPLIPRRKRRGVIAAQDPNDPAADAFRVLGAGMAHGLPAGGANHQGDRPRGSRSKAILVVSPSLAEGKSTVVANLAAVFAETGKKVLIISTDFRNPSVHQLFGVSNADGLSKALQADGETLLDGYAQRTPIGNVRVVPSGDKPPRPAELLGSDAMRRMLDKAREVADVVLLDSGSVLRAGDATYLVPEVDAVLVVARAGATTAGEAEQTTQRLRWLRARLAGVVLNGSAEDEVEEITSPD
jgi:capsular exopolysaccharide synthesis family protein